MKYKLQFSALMETVKERQRQKTNLNICYSFFLTNQWWSSASWASMLLFQLPFRYPVFCLSFQSIQDILSENSNKHKCILWGLYFALLSLINVEVKWMENDMWLSKVCKCFYYFILVPVSKCNKLLFWFWISVQAQNRKVSSLKNQRNLHNLHR